MSWQSLVRCCLICGIWVANFVVLAKGWHA
jgi:hypothetical protein